MRLTINRLALAIALGTLPMASSFNGLMAQEGGEKPEAVAQEEGAEEAEKAEEKPALTVGSKAPGIDIEFWLQEGDDKMEPITGFEQGKVYVVEFWATWCPPCVASMPHLAELQKQYKDQDVRIISVSNEDLDTVKTFLEKEVPNAEEPTTFASLTNAYSLTTDPDESVYTDYMLAAGQNGIPTAFVVGKSGEIEWIGHPMQMDSVIEDVVAGKWDRAAYAAQMAEEKADEAAMMKAAQAFQSGDADKAVQVVSERLEKVTSVMSTLQLSSILVQIGQRVEVAPEALQQAADKLKAMSGDAEEMLQPYMFDIRARLLEKKGDLDGAIESQQEAIKRAEGEIKERMISFLEDLRKKKDAPEEEKKPEGEDK